MLSIKFNAAAFKQKLQQQLRRIESEMRRRADQFNMRNPWLRFLKFHYPDLYRKLTQGEKLMSFDQRRLSEAYKRYAR